MKEFHWRDKAKHLVVSLVVSLSVLFFSHNVIPALVVIIILTVAKEIYDQFKTNKNTLAEMLSDSACNLIGLGLAYLIYYLII